MFLLLLNPPGLFGSDEKCQRAGAIDNIVCYGWVLSKTLCVTVGCYRQHRMLPKHIVRKENSAIEINFHLPFRKKSKSHLVSAILDVHERFSETDITLKDFSVCGSIFSFLHCDCR